MDIKRSINHNHGSLDVDADVKIDKRRLHTNDDDLEAFISAEAEVGVEKRFHHLGHNNNDLNHAIVDAEVDIRTRSDGLLGSALGKSLKVCSLSP